MNRSGHAMLEVRETSGNEKPVFGISEWMCYYANYDKPCPGPGALNECVDLEFRPRQSDVEGGDQAGQ